MGSSGGGSSLSSVAHPLPPPSHSPHSQKAAKTVESITGLKVSLVPHATLLAAAPTPAAAVAVGEALALMARAQADITRWDLETRPQLQAEYDELRKEVRRLADEGGGEAEEESEAEEGSDGSAEPAEWGSGGAKGGKAE